MTVLLSIALATVIINAVITWILCAQMNSLTRVLDVLKEWVAQTEKRLSDLETHARSKDYWCATIQPEPQIIPTDKLEDL